MPPIEMGPPRPISAIESRFPRPADARGDSPPRAAPETRAVVTSVSLDPGARPVDAGRVAEIRTAIENGAYPVIPARVADAMIAGGYLLKAPK